MSITPNTHITVDPSNFDLSSRVQDRLYSQDIDDPEDDLFDMTSDSSEASSPEPIIVQLPGGNGNEETDESDMAPHFEGVMTRDESRKRKNKAQSKKNKKKKRMQEVEAGIIPKVREKARDKQLNNAGVLFSSISAENGPVSQGGYIAVNEGRKKKEKSRSPEDKVAADLVDKGYRLVKWDGSQIMAVVDKDFRILVILAGVPEKGENWERDCEEAVKELKKACEQLKKKKSCKTGRRGEFSTLTTGFSYGGGQRKPMNFSIRSKKKKELVDHLCDTPCFKRIAGFSSSVFGTWAPDLFGYYKENLDKLMDNDKTLKKPFNSVFPAATFNLGPQTVCKPHIDFANLAFGYCAITALGEFDYQRGGHLVLEEMKLVIEFPAGSTILMPSAIVTHWNLPVGLEETRYSFTQYAAGGLFRWVDNGFQTAAEAEKKGKGKNLAGSNALWKKGLALLPKLFWWSPLE